MVGKLGLALGLGLFLLAGPASANVQNCQSLKLKASGKKAFKILKAHGSNAKNPNPGRLASTISKAQSRFTKTCKKAMSQGNCPVTGNDCATLEAKTDGFVDDVFAELASPSGAFLHPTTGVLE